MVLETVKPYAPWFKDFNVEYALRYGTAEKSCKRKQCDVEGVYKKLEKMVLLGNSALDTRLNSMEEGNSCWNYTILSLFRKYLGDIDFKTPAYP
jgi:hypothetical protein